jgi:hypothetical protein
MTSVGVGIRVGVKVAVGVRVAVAVKVAVRVTVGKGVAVMVAPPTATPVTGTFTVVAPDAKLTLAAGQKTRP